MQFRQSVDKGSRILQRDEPEQRWQPQLFDASRRDHQRELAKLARRGARVSNPTNISRQLAELMECRDPSIKDNDTEKASRVASHLDGVPSQEYGVWVYYPWSHNLVQILPRAEFHEVRSSRNHYKVTEEEERILRACRVGIVGLSVGHSIAQVLAMEGCASEYRLADPDTISLSNLNRLPCPIGDIGVNKATLAARRMYEFDPYLTIGTFQQGIDEKTLDQFILDGGKLNLLVEECDDLYMKVLIRERARVHRVPVIMETNDRGMLDIERFDLEPERPIFHGMLGNTRAEELRGLSSREKVPFVLKLLGEGNMSQRLAASLVEIDKTILSWPQLGSGAMLGGGVAGDTARRILTGELNTSGRFYVDVHELISDSPKELVVPVDRDETARDPLAPGRHDVSVTEPLRASEQARPSEDFARRVVAAGILAPSGGNAQPWKFIWTQSSRLRCFIDTNRAESFLDFEQHAAYLALGAAVENIRLAALDAGYSAELSSISSPDRNLAFEVHFEPRRDVVSQSERALIRAIEQRATNRRLGVRSQIHPSNYRALVDAAASHNAELQILSKGEELSEVGAILGQCDRFRFFSEPLFREMMSEMRWNSLEAERTRDGIDIATLELRDVDEAGLKLLSSWKVVQFLKRLGVGGAIEDLSRKAVQAASAVGLLTMKGFNAETFFLGGRALQSVWLSATANGLSIQPMSTLPYIFGRLLHGSGFDDNEIRVLTALRSRYEGLFRLDKNIAELLLFRIAKTGPPAVRSLRRPVSEVLSFE